MPGDMMTATEVAEMTGLSVQNIWKLGQRGKLPRLKIEWAVRYPRAAVEQLVKERYSGTA